MTRSTQLSYLRAGSGPRTLVLQHGFLASAREWEPFLDEFSATFQVIVPDLPGFGASGHLLGPERMEIFARELVTFLGEIGVDQFSLVGHSMGGAIAQQVAVDFGSRLHKLVLYGTSCSGALPDRFETFDESIQRLQRHGTSAHADRVVPTWFRAGAAHPAFKLSRQAAEGMSLQAAVAAQRAMAAWNISARLPEINCPTLVICGDHDASCSPKESYRIWSGIRNAQLCIVPDCAHNVHLERPHIFVPIVREFLD